MLPQLRDLVERYHPSVLFTDGEWSHPSEVWRSCDFLAWLFNESPVKDEIVINDRWGSETRSVHGGYFTTEYGEVGGGKELTEGRKWEENRGVGASFGYNRNEDVTDHLTEHDLIHLLVDTVSKGGNLLLNIGPTADGRIPVIQQERLLQLGEWLTVNGEAIYGTRRWRVPAEGDCVRYTSSGDTVYARCLQWPGRELVLRSPEVVGDVEADLLGHAGRLRWQISEGALRLSVAPLGVDDVPCRHAYVFRLKGVR